jgi:serine phosphatase RsbU (regulator of sigma subunit)
MDMSLCLIDKKNLKLEFAGAYNSAYVIRNERLVQLKGDRFAIGSNQAYKQSYTNQTFDLKEGDVIYLFSDGYADQFGGPKNKKYLIKSFREKLLSISTYDMETQEQMLQEELASWQGSNDQVDDILVIGFKI